MVLLDSECSGKPISFAGMCIILTGKRFFRVMTVLRCFPRLTLKTDEDFPPDDTLFEIRSTVHRHRIIFLFFLGKHIYDHWKCTEFVRVVP